MSTTALVWALKQYIPCQQKMLLIILSKLVNDEYGYAWPKYEYLAKECGMSVRSCKRHMQWLVDHGLVTRQRQIFNGRQGTNKYYVNVNIMIFQGCQDDTAGVLNLAQQECQSGTPSIELQNTPKDKSNSVAVPTTGTEESDMKQKDEQTVLGILDTGHKSFGPKTKSEIFAKLKYRSGQLTAKSCGHIWTNAVAHASKEDYGHEPEVTIKEQGRLLLAQKRCGGDFAEVVWFVMQDWVGFTVWAEKNSDAFDSPLRPSLGYFQKWAHVAGEYYKEMSKVSKAPTKKVALPKVQVLTKPNVKVQTKGKMTPEEWAELQKEFESDE